MEHIGEAINSVDAKTILCHQVPLYNDVDNETCFNNFYENVPYSQNLEDLIVSIEMEAKLDIQPLLSKDNWFIQRDITNTPSISFASTTETRSGILNGIKVLVDLGNKKFV